LTAGLYTSWIHLSKPPRPDNRAALLEPPRLPSQGSSPESCGGMSTLIRTQRGGPVKTGQWRFVSSYYKEPRLISHHAISTWQVQPKDQGNWGQGVRNKKELDEQTTHDSMKCSSVSRLWSQGSPIARRLRCQNAPQWPMRQGSSWPVLNRWLPTPQREVGEWV
jgi:hypothetical protein